MNRPTEHDDDVLRAAAEWLWEQIKKNLGDEVAGPEASGVESIFGAIKYYDDGYRIARELERDGWDPDAELVNILDDAMLAKCRAVDASTRKWVEANNIRPAFSVGARVRFKENRSGSYRVGEVSKVEEERAMYWVFCAELGHVREGVGTHAVILPYEQVEAA